MIRPISTAISSVRGLGRDQTGAIAVIAALTMTMLLGLAGLTIDMGNLMAANSQLKASTNGAAMAGANALIQPNASAATAQTAATNWANANKVPNLTMVSVTAKASCQPTTFVSTLPNCSANFPNVVTVTQTATVPGILAKLVGFNGPFTISAKSSASKAGGTAVPLNILFVLDATQSMSKTPSGGQSLTCAGSGLSGGNLTPENCALYGIQQVLSVMVTPQDQIGIMVFPGYKPALATPCTKTTPGNVVPYYTSGISFTVVPLSTNYLTSPGILNPASNLVKAVGNGATAGCFDAQGGTGSYLAETIAAAQAAFPQVAGTQNVMIILSDGQANLSCPPFGTCDVAGGPNGTAWTKPYPTGVNKGNGQCSQAVTEAGNATTAGTWVYSVAYVMKNEPNENVNCQGDSITPCTEMQKIATDPTRFFTTDTTVCGQNSTNPAADLPIILKQIAYSLNKARLIPAT